MQSLGDMIVKQVDAIGDFLLEALVAVGEKVGGAVMAGAAALKDASGNAMASVKNTVDNSFSVGRGGSEKAEPQLARSKQIEQEVSAPAIPEQAKSAVTSLGMKNSEIVASQMVSMAEGQAVSPTAVAFGGQQQSMGIGA